MFCEELQGRRSGVEAPFLSVNHSVTGFILNCHIGLETMWSKMLGIAIDKLMHIN